MKRKKRRNGLKVGVLTLGAIAGSADATTWFVDDSATSGGDGETWATAFQTIQDAVNNVELQAGDEIHVGQGTYKPSSQTSPIELKNAVSIQGGYAGTGAQNPDLRNPSVYVTVLDGHLSGSTYAYHVVHADSTVGPPSFSGSTPYEDRANLDGATITGGVANGSSADDKMGGGIFIEEGNPTIRNCRIIDNEAIECGGGVMCWNTATAPEFRNCWFESNSVEDTENDNNGGGACTNEAITVINSTFINNTVDGDGGGVAGSLRSTSNTLTLKLIDCRFIENQADVRGGGVFTSANSGGSLLMVNCEVNGNTSGGDGGGISSWFGDITLKGCTIVQNSGNQVGGGLAAYSINNEGSIIENCIFYYNDAGDNIDIHNNVDVDHLSVKYCDTEQSYSDILEVASGPGSGTGLIDDVPQFVDRDGANNTPGDDDDDLHLSCGSPCIDTGSNSAAPADADNADEDSSTAEKSPSLGVLGDEFDLTDRLVSWPGPYVDMGAYERTIKSPCTTPQEGDAAPLPCTDGRVNVDDLLLVIISWGTCNAGSEFCPGDLAATWGSVDIDDLLVVINNWSEQCLSGSYNAGSLSSVEDCMDEATNLYEPYSPDWDEFVEKCIEALCEAEIIDCD